MATNRNDILAATDDQQADGALLTGLNGDDVLLADGTQTWTATLAALNGSGVAGTVTVTLSGTQLQVQVQATGLEPNQIHAMHIHGRTGDAGVAEDSGVAGAVRDVDADGFVELAEARPVIGPPLLPLQVDGQFPTAAADGTLNFTATYDITDLPGGADIRDLLPMDMRAVELHGLTVDADDGLLTGGEVNGTAGYKATLPVAAGELVDGDADAADTAQGAVLRGDNGGDMLVGDAGDDLLLGGRGNDVLAGQGGDDQLVGGSGRDTFIVGDGNDVVVDFETSQDRLVFADGTALGGIQAANTDGGLQLTAGDATVTLVGVTANAATVDLSDWVA